MTNREDVYTGKTIPEVLFDTVERSKNRSLKINPTLSFSHGAGDTGPGKIIGNWEYQLWLDGVNYVEPKKGDCNPIGATLVGGFQIGMVTRPVDQVGLDGTYKQAGSWESEGYDISEICHLWHGHADDDPPCDPPSDCCAFSDEGPYWTTDDPDGVTDMPNDGQSNSSFALDITVECDSTHTTKLIVHSSDLTETLEGSVYLGAPTTGTTNSSISPSGLVISGKTKGSNIKESVTLYIPYTEEQVMGILREFNRLQKDLASRQYAISAPRFGRLGGSRLSYKVAPMWVQSGGHTTYVFNNNQYTSVTVEN